MELIDALHELVQDVNRAAQSTDMATGTVQSVKPLRVLVDGAMEPLRPEVLLLTEGVIEKKFPIIEHSHMGVHGQTSLALMRDEYHVREHDADLPVREDVITVDGVEVKKWYIIFNEALRAGDKVLLMKVQNGQRYIILSRIFEVDGHANNPGK